MVRRLALAWRELTGGTRRGLDGCRRTLIACSGGGDSSGLVLALASAIPDAEGLLTVGHIVHDLRPREEALADRDAAAALAEGLGLPFVETEVAARKAGGNAEAAARRLRYAALTRLAEAEGCRFVASAHHADDQLETVLMGLMRGAGPRGLAGAARRRRLGRDGPWLIRPALGVTRADLLALCEGAGWRPVEDRTNLDTTRLRAALRHQVLPVLERLRPGAALRAGRSARLIADAARLVQDRAAAVLGKAGRHDGEVIWEREDLRGERAVVVGAALRMAASELMEGHGADRVTGRLITPAVRLIRGTSTDPRVFQWSGVEVQVTAHRVRMRRRVHG